MSTWRLLGELPQAKTREEIKNQSLCGWNPWQRVWNRCEERGIVVPDPRNSNRFRHILTYWYMQDGKVIKFAAELPNLGVWRFFVPAVPSEKGAFEARTPRREGFWRSRLDADEDLPWPGAQPEWPERDAFLEMLHRAESQAEKIAYRGFSLCRICTCRNGSQSFRLDVWEWPWGYRHYLTEHNVRPSHDFELFIRDRVNDTQD